MKKLSVKKGSQCMACLECVRACSTAFYKEFHQDKSCIQIIERNGQPKPMVCVQCGKCAQACEHGAITQNAKGVYMINKKLCVQCGKCKGSLPVRRAGSGAGAAGLQVHRLRHLRQGLPDGDSRGRGKVAVHRGAVFGQRPFSAHGKVSLRPVFLRQIFP